MASVPCPWTITQLKSYKNTLFIFAISITFPHIIQKHGQLTTQFGALHTQNSLRK